MKTQLIIIQLEAPIEHPEGSEGFTIRGGIEPLVSFDEKTWTGVEQIAVVEPGCDVEQYVRSKLSQYKNAGTG